VDPPEERLFPVVDDLLDVPGISGGKGLRLVGHQWSPRSHGSGASRAIDPYRWLDVARNTDTHALLEAAGVGTGELPALFFEDGFVLRNPERRQVAERLGRPLSAAFDLYQFAIVGAGPAGLAGAVYGASEGLRTLLLDRHSPGGQAGSSSKIENYLGFPAGVSGSELARRAVTQARRLGAEFVVPVEVTGLSIDAGQKRLALSDGRELVTRTVLVATGMTYREHPAPGVLEHTGAGVYYGAATTEALAFSGKRVLVVGGGNSAGQGAMYLARHAKEVQIAVRRDALRECMSQYLIEQIEKTPSIRVRTRTEVDRVEGDEHVERVAFASRTPAAARWWRSRTSTRCSSSLARIREATGCRPACCATPGFVLTGRDLLAAEGFARIWKRPGAPAARDQRPACSRPVTSAPARMNRVASAVGEGSMVSAGFEYLALT
jgi:thioredoxin reductase (NADPH)